MTDDSKRRLFSLFLFAVLVVVAFGIVKYAFKKYEGPQIDQNVYQAVFLDGNQQYFGHIKDLSTPYPYMTGVYYVRSFGSYKPDLFQQDFTLVKLGDEVHGPEDKMYLNWDKVLFWENLKPDSRMVKAITREKARREKTAKPAVPRS